MRIEVVIPSYALVYEKKKLRKVLLNAGQEIAAVTRKLIRMASKGKKGASKPGQPPHSQSGLLLKSIKAKTWRKQGADGVSIRDMAYYALFLQVGAKGGGGDTHNKANILKAGETNWRGRVLRGQNRMKAGAVNKARILLPRPFLSVALDQRKVSIQERIQEAVLGDMQFRKLKA